MMAVPNMIVTLLANTEKYSSGLKKAGTGTKSFGEVAMKALTAVAGIIVGAGVALTKFATESIKSGNEAKKADLRIKYMAQNMSGLGKKTDETVKRLKKYATQVQMATGLDDESIKAIQAKLLMFEKLSKSADKTGGMFDRVTKASLDLASIGFGTAETNAVKLARMMEDPIKNMNLMARSGVQFTEAEKRKAIALEETNGKMAAADFLMQTIEKRSGGLSEKVKDPWAVMGQMVDEVGEKVGRKLLPAVEDIVGQFEDWMTGPGGKKAINDFVQKFKDFGDWITSPSGQHAIENLVIVFERTLELTTGIVDMLLKISEWLAGPDYKSLDDAGVKAWNLMGGSNNGQTGGSGWSGNISGVGGGAGNPTTGGPTRMADKGGTAIIVNFNVPVDSVAAGREVARVLADYDRANGYRR